METSHGSPPPETYDTEFSVESEYTYLDTQAHNKPRGAWEGANQRQSNKARQSKTKRAKLNSHVTTTHARGNHPQVNSRSPS